MQGKPLTAKFLDALKPAPKGQRVTIADAGLRGFAVRVTDSGVKSFSFRYRFKGDQRRVTLGTYPATTLADAHDAARGILSVLEKGDDPEGAPIKLPETAAIRTVKDVAEKFITEYLGERERRTGDAMAQILRRDLLPRLGDRDIKSIDRSDIEDVITAVRDRARRRARDHVQDKAADAVYEEAATAERERAAREGRNPHYRAARRAAKGKADAARAAAKDAADQAAKGAGASANRVHAVIRKLWNWAWDEKRYVTENPAKFRHKVEERPRDRVLDPAELRALWDACGSVHVVYRDIVRLLTLTGQRLNEIARLTWDEVHGDTGELRLPGERTKNRRAHIVPLPDAAVAIIAARDKVEGCPYVFSLNGKTPVSGFSKWKDELDGRLGFGAAFRLHDLRHTVATGMAELEIEPHIIEAVLNHASGVVSGIAGRYNNYSYLKEKRAALARWAAHVERVVTPTAGKVVTLRAGTGAAAEALATA